MAHVVIEANCPHHSGWVVATNVGEDWRLGWPTRKCGPLGLLGIVSTRVLRCTGCGGRVPSESHPVLRRARV